MREPIQLKKSCRLLKKDGETVLFESSTGRWLRISTLVDSGELRFLVPSAGNDPHPDEAVTIGAEGSLAIKSQLSKRGFCPYSLSEDTPNKSAAVRKSTLTIQLVVTWDCNMRCAYCKHQEQRALGVRSEPPNGLLARLMADLNTWHPDILAVHCAGGETTVAWRRFRRIITELEHFASEHAVELQTGLTTNGLRVTLGQLECLKAHRVGLTVSLDGPAHVHDTRRVASSGAPTHCAVLKTLEQVRRLAFPMA